MFFAIPLLVASVIAGALAQSVSTGCENTVVALAADPRSQCLNPRDLIQVFVQGVDSSIVTPVDTWLKGLCSRGPCSNDDLAFIVTNFTTGCATELGNPPPDALVPIVQKIYPSVRKAACLADASKNNQLCVTQTLTIIETATGTLTHAKFHQIVTAIASGQSVPELSNVNLCTPCVKQIYNVGKTDFPEVFGPGTAIATHVEASCGAPFVDGASDPNIVQTASG